MRFVIVYKLYQNKDERKDNKKAGIIDLNIYIRRIYISKEIIGNIKEKV